MGFIRLSSCFRKTSVRAHELRSSRIVNFLWNNFHKKFVMNWNSHIIDVYTSMLNVIFWAIRHCKRQLTRLVHSHWLVSYVPDLMIANFLMAKLLQVNVKCLINNTVAYVPVKIVKLQHTSITYMWRIWTLWSTWGLSIGHRWSWLCGFTLIYSVLCQHRVKSKLDSSHGYENLKKVRRIDPAQKTIS